MKIFNSLEDIKNIGEGAVALGNFDGVHKGHQELILRTVRYAASQGLKSAVFTFENHPKNEIAGETVIKNILYPQDKEKLIRHMGVEYLFSIPFNETIRNMPAATFIEDVLRKNLRMRVAFCGFNYRFGLRGQGTPELLSELGPSQGFRVQVLPPFLVGGQVVSSTLIRNLIDEGRVDQCRKYLGRNYDIGGTVVVGNKIGRTIGFPTCNITIDDDMVSPSNGVYITCCNYNGVSYPSVTNVGRKPTIGEFAKNVETHIFDFNHNLYGKKIRVEFFEKIRDEIKFSGLDALTTQIRKDCIYAGQWHEKHK